MEINIHMVDSRHSPDCWSYKMCGIFKCVSNTQKAGLLICMIETKGIDKKTIK